MVQKNASEVQPGRPRVGVNRLFHAYRRRRYTVLFASLLITLVFSPLLVAISLPGEIVSLFLAGNLCAAVAITDHRGRHFNWPALAGLAGVVVVRLVAESMGATFVASLSHFAWSAIAFIAASHALRFALTARRVDREHVNAALSAYLLAGLFFGVIYASIDRLWPGAFFVASRDEIRALSLSEAFYFSFVTLATVGYGDIAPVSDAVRGLAIFEAIAGQLYLAVLLARLVSLYAVARHEAADRADEGSPPPPSAAEHRPTSPRDQPDPSARAAGRRRLPDRR